MNSIDYVVNKVLDAIRKDAKKKTTGYDAIGTVRRIEGNIAWVHFDNGLDETPVNKSIDCKKGDKVRVRVSNGSAFLVGNDSAPPTDDTKAEHAQITAEGAEKTAKDAQVTASEAVEEAEHTSNYFWHVDGSGAESGAHITEVPQAEFQANPSGGNLLMQSVGIYIRKGLNNLASFLSDGLHIYAADGDEVASFTKTNGAVLNTPSNQTSIKIGNQRITFYNNVYDIESLRKRGFIEFSDDDVTVNYQGLVAEMGSGGRIHVIGLINCRELTISGHAPFTTFTATGSGTLSSSGGAISCTGTVPTGYTPIAVQSIVTDHNYTALIGRFSLTSDGVDVSFGNRAGNGSLSVNVTATILCTSL